VSIAGTEFDAPSIAYSWEMGDAGTTLACLPVDCPGRRGILAVTVGGVERPVYFVTTDAEHVDFFRFAIDFEDADEGAFPAIATSAFPELRWADGVWSGLNKFSRPFRDLRSQLVNHLSVLNDHASELFRTLSSTRPDEIGRRLSALGADASDENGRTKRHAPCQRDRTRTYNGRHLTFWWHTKLQPNVDRIHFLYHAEDERHRGFIIVGIFVDHCTLLN
jgi:hypothetical protein